MHPAAEALAFAATLTFAGAATGCAIYWSAAVVRIAATLRTLPSAEAGLRLPEPEGGWPGVCVVIPAHNEERSIGTVLASLLAQDYPNLRVVLALDRCTDGTRAAAERVLAQQGGADRVEIVEVRHKPDGWAGKTHAAHRGVHDSSVAHAADLLLFADADTEFHPGCVRAATALLRHRGLGMLSLMSDLTRERWFERVVQPAAALELLRQYPLRSANKWPKPRPFANGQFMLFERAAYDAAGGHEGVREELLEDIALARRTAKAGRRPGALLAGPMLRCRMYGDWASFRRGWKRIYTEAANRRARRMLALSRRVRTTGALLPASSVAAIAAGVLGLALGPGGWEAVFALVAGCAGAGAFLGAVGLATRAARAPLREALAHPVGAWLVGGILREAAHDLRDGRATAWGGLEYRLADRGPPRRSRPGRADPGALPRW